MGFPYFLGSLNIEYSNFMGSISLINNYLRQTANEKQSIITVINYDSNKNMLHKIKKLSQRVL